MSSYFSTLRQLLLSAAIGVLSGCADLHASGEDGAAIVAPKYSVGDRWVYRAQDGFRAPVMWQETREVTAITATGVTVRVTQKGSVVDNVRTEIWAAPLARSSCNGLASLALCDKCLG
jgi:hypothetical protein